MTRLRSGLLGDRRSVGKRVSELRIDVGQGYRLYYTMQGRTVIILLRGGGKKTQRPDIGKAQAMAKAFGKTRKEAGTSRVRDRQSAYSARRRRGDEFHFTGEELKTSPFDPADYLEDDGSQIHLLRDAFSTGHPGYIADAIDAVSRARARREAGLGRLACDKSPDRKSEPTLATLLTVLEALGLRLEVVEDRGGGPADTPASRTA